MSEPHDQDPDGDGAAQEPGMWDRAMKFAYQAAAQAPTALGPGAETVGTVIAGRYTLIEKLPEGGMGTVWLAEQTTPVKRKVALKLIKAGMDSRSVLARFEAERQALALMNHPNIAKVLDGGLTDAVRPFFVMEYVDGVRLTDYCDTAKLSISDRLNIFVQVCAAVEHAHQKAIIHRDLKPSNILVAVCDDRPVPKVIDFGLVKALHVPLTDRSLHTAHEIVVGTPPYMSPEQAELNNLDVDTRSDIYSLGVVLYELLTGDTPVELSRFKNAAPDEIRRIIREEDPPRPSIRLSSAETLASLAASRQSEPRALTRQLRRELDWIVMKALRKERKDRYQTANDHARDVQHYLADEVVGARPPSTGYRLRKFIRRHETGLLTGTAITLAVLIASGGLGWSLWQQAEQHAELGERRADTYRAVSESLGKAVELAGQAQRMPRSSSKEAAEALALWNQAADALHVAETALSTGIADEALRQEVASRRSLIEEGRHQTDQRRLQTVRQYTLLQALDDARMASATLIDNTFDYGGASARYAAAFRAYGLEVNVGDPDQLAPRIRTQEPAIREALCLALDDWAFVAARARTAPTAADLKALAVAADDDPWRKRVRKTVDPAALRELGMAARKVPVAPSGLALLANKLYEAGEHDEALALLRSGRDRYPRDYYLHFNLGSALGNKTTVEIDEAIGCLRAALALQPEGSAASAAYNNLGIALADKMQADEAIAAYETAIKLNPTFAAPHVNLGRTLKARNRVADAVAEYEKAIKLDSRSAPAHVNLGLALLSKNLDQGLDVSSFSADDISLRTAEQFKNLEDAMVEFQKAIKIDPGSASAHFNLGYALQARQQLQGAIEEFKLAVQYDPKSAPAHVALGVGLGKSGQSEDAITELKKAIDCDPRFAPAHVGLGKALWFGKYPLDNAIGCFRKAIELDPKNADAHNNLGNALVVKGQLDQAVAECKKAVNLKPRAPRYHGALGNALLDGGWFAEARGSTLTAKGLLPPDDRHLKLVEEQLAHCDHMLALEKRLLEIVADKGPAPDNDERLRLIKEVCRRQRRNAAAVRLFCDAFRMDAKMADDMVQHHRYNAALHAALAAAGYDRDADKLDDGERKRLREQALSWLRGDLDVWQKRLAAGTPKDREAVRQTMQLWQSAGYLATVREMDALKKLPPEEQVAWMRLWTDVAVLLQNAVGNGGEGRKLGRAG
jgi:tetratricopeptide (TPR) repeat protein